MVTVKAMNSYDKWMNQAEIFSWNVKVFLLFLF